MKVLIATVLVLLLIAGWFLVEIPAKLKYDQARREMPASYSVMPMDQPSVAFLAEVQSSWTCWSDVTNGPDSDVLKLAGKQPSVHNLIEVFNYQMPPFQWFSPSRNRDAAVLNLLRAKFMPASLDKQWHVSADAHAAFLHCRTNIVLLYRDEPDGLRTMCYARKKVPAAPRRQGSLSRAAAGGALP